MSIPQTENSLMYSSLAIKVGLLVGQNQAIRERILQLKELQSQAQDQDANPISQEESPEQEESQELFSAEIQKLKELKSRLSEVDQSLASQKEQLETNEKQNNLVKQSIDTLQEDFNTRDTDTIQQDWQDMFRRAEVCQEVIKSHQFEQQQEGEQGGEVQEEEDEQ